MISFYSLLKRVQDNLDIGELVSGQLDLQDYWKVMNPRVNLLCLLVCAFSCKLSEAETTRRNPAASQQISRGLLQVGQGSETAMWFTLHSDEDACLPKTSNERIKS